MTDNPALWLIALSAILSALFYILRSALKESITSSIKLMADKQLEELKSTLSARIEALRHEYEVNQLQTSLSFDHKRNAFSAVLARLLEAKNEMDGIGV
jgi:hypothetical protein